ncbi:MAG: diguanylate cyclase [Magnetococcales bacterium]|nr:diguanylate cyclase [Magnetococcales bacterium]
MMTESTHLDHFEVFPWNENFETGNETIDTQHKVLAELLNNLASTLVTVNSEEINAAFDKLAEYANEHFDEEESIWFEHFKDDPWFISHQMSHATFLPKIAELKTIDDGRSVTDMVEQTVKFLIRWLAFHIIDNDKRMAISLESILEGASVIEAKLIADKKMSGSMRTLIETVLQMYDGLSTRTLDLMRERNARKQAEKELQEANNKLKELSITDELTGLYNRRYLDSAFETEVRRALREGTAIAYYLIDIDYFKSFNDNYGHLEGDRILKKVGSQLNEVCRRPGDLAFRVGGEEFGVLVSSASNKEAKEFGEKIRTAIEALNVPHSYSEVCEHVTVSVGAVYKKPSVEDTLVEFASIADRRLYKAKDLGRNQVVSTDN